MPKRPEKTRRKWNARSIETRPVLQVIAGLHDVSEGPTRTVSRLCSELAELGHDVTVMTLYGPGVARSMRQPGAPPASEPRANSDSAPNKNG